MAIFVIGTYYTPGWFLVRKIKYKYKHVDLCWGTCEMRLTHFLPFMGQICICGTLVLP